MGTHPAALPPCLVWVTGSLPWGCRHHVLHCLPAHLRLWTTLHNAVLCRLLTPQWVLSNIIPAAGAAVLPHGRENSHATTTYLLIQAAGADYLSAFSLTIMLLPNAHLASCAHRLPSFTNNNLCTHCLLCWTNQAGRGKQAKTGRTRAKGNARRAGGLERSTGCLATPLPPSLARPHHGRGCLTSRHI